MNSKRKDAPALDYRLDVRDFGPIARASVELRPLTVFIGPSNTGKSYLAMLLYVLHRCLGTGPRGPDVSLVRSMATYAGNVWRNGPIELKSGAFGPESVAEQLQGGADMANGWLPTMQCFRFVPVVAHGRGIPKARIRSLQKATVTFRTQTRRLTLIRCGAPLAPVLR